MRAGYSEQRARKVWVNFCCTLLFSWAFQAFSQPIKMIVAYNEGLDFSQQVWQTVSNVHQRSPLPFEVTAVGYRAGDFRVLSNTLAQATGPVLVLGPAGSDDAVSIDAFFRPRQAPTLFVSPSVSTRLVYTNIVLVPACLPDKLRLEGVAQTAPQFWAGSAAAFIGMKGRWGEELYRQLGNTNNLVVSLKPYFIGDPNAIDSAEYRAAIAECKQQRFPVLFLALEDSGEVRSFLNELNGQNTHFAPYAPTICLLADYTFKPVTIDEGRRSKVISKDWAREYCLLMASEAMLPDETDLYPGLTADLLEILRALHKSRAGDPQQFFEDVRRLFTGSRDESKRLLSGVSIANSHYYAFLQGAQDYPAELKWLKTPFSLFRKQTPSWERLSEKDVPMDFFLSLLGSRVPWLKSSVLVAAFFLALIAGWYMEVKKRFIYLSRTPRSVLPRIALWVGLLCLCFCASVYLSWAGIVNSSNFLSLLLLCLSPLAIILLVENAAVSKIPVLKPVSTTFEKLLETLINSRAREDCKRHRREILQEIKDVPRERRESELWRMWCESLRGVNGEQRARRLFERGSQSARLWDNMLDRSAREHALIQVLAYTRVVSEFDQRNRGKTEIHHKSGDTSLRSPPTPAETR